MQPKEDPEIKAARLRDRQIAERELTTSSEKLASGLTSDMQRFYSRGFSMFGMR